MGPAVLREKLAFIKDGEVILEIKTWMKAGALDIPQKESFVTLPVEEVGEMNRFWVRRVDINYKKEPNARSGYVTEIEVQLEDA